MWEIEVGPGASAATPERKLGLTRARSAVLTRRVNGPHRAQFTLSSAIIGDGLGDPLAAEERAAIRLRESDLWMWRSGQLLFRGRIVSMVPQATADAWTGTFQAVDYRGLLLQSARLEPPVPTFTGVDQAQIAWQLVQHRQGQDGGDWGITEGIGSTSGQLRDENSLTAGRPVAEAIDAIAGRINGFEWQISPALKLDRWSPRRTRDQGVVLAYGSEIAGYTAVPGEWGNAAVYSGTEESVPAVAETGDVATDPRGRWTLFGSSPSASDQTTLQQHADGMLANTGAVSWSVELASGMWDQLHGDDRGVDACDVGEIVRLVLGPDGVDTPARVVEMQVTCGDDGPGSEVVRLELVEEVS